MGTACIPAWLGNNNSYPAYQENFFAAHSRPYLEHAITNERLPVGSRWTRRFDFTDPVGESCNYLCKELVLGSGVRDMA